MALSKVTLVLFFVVALFFNVASLTLSGVNMAVSGVLSSVGLTTVAQRQTAARVKEKAAREAAEKAVRQAEKKVAREAAEKAAREAQLKAARQAASLAEEKAARRLAEKTAREVAEKAASRKFLMTGITREISEKITERARLQAARNTASVFGESIPFVGIAVIASALALEVKDACDNARDISAMAAAFEAENDPEAVKKQIEENFDCKEFFGEGFSIPTSDEIWVKVKNSQTEVWHAMRNIYGDDLPRNAPKIVLEDDTSWLSEWYTWITGN